MATPAARAGPGLVALSAITLVWPTWTAVIPGTRLAAAFGYLSLTGS
ncbi:MAG TPA: hypothetical protein VH478_14150 [Trebonia sp.]|nr:hypothetical protein [Trebonia sp.]